MFSKRLKELRDNHNYSMDKFVELYNQRYNAKMNKSTLSRYENGLQDPIYTVVVNIADFFNVSIDYLSGSAKKEIESQGLNSEEFEILNKYRQLSSLSKQKVATYIDDLLINEQHKQSTGKENKPTRRTPSLREAIEIQKPRPIRSDRLDDDGYERIAAYGRGVRERKKKK